MNVDLGENEILVLKTVDSEGKGYGGFQYPMELGAVVTAPDWKPNLVCGGGLHGLPWGAGGLYLSEEKTAIWLLLAVDASRDYVHGGGDFVDKCKFKTGRIVYTGDRTGAIAILQEYAPANVPIVYSNQVNIDGTTQTAGYRSMQKTGNASAQTAGNESTQTAGAKTTQTAGCWSTQTAGDESTQTAGNGSTQKAGDESTQKAGDGSTQKAGDGSTQTAGDGSTQTAGNMSAQTAGCWSTQIAGAKTTQTAGDGSAQTAGANSAQTSGAVSTQKVGCHSTQTAGNKSIQTAGISTVQIGRWRDVHDGLHVATRIVTEAEANKPYRFEDGTWTEVKKGEEE